MNNYRELSRNDSAIPGLGDAIRALEAQGIEPTAQAVEEWLTSRKVAGPREEAQSPVAKGPARLTRFAQVQNKLKRKPGRPRIVASWFPTVAKTMADGTTLGTALATNGLSLSASEVRALYRNRTFRALYQEARRRYLLENWGRKGPSLRSVLGSYF